MDKTHIKSTKKRISDVGHIYLKKLSRILRNVEIINIADKFRDLEKSKVKHNSNYKIPKGKNIETERDGY